MDGMVPPFWTEYHTFPTSLVWRPVQKREGRRISTCDRLPRQPGAIHTYGRVVANAIDWRNQRGKGLDTMFAPGASVTFGGCSVAAGSLGWEFLEEFGRTFLLGGGIVQGSMNMMVGVHWIGPLPVPWGAMKFVKVKPGGVIEQH